MSGFESNAKAPLPYRAWEPQMSHSYQPFQPVLTRAGLERFGLTLACSLPCRALRGVVHSYLQVNAAVPTPYPTIPDGTQAIFISQEGSRISGAQTRARDVDILLPGQYFGIHFFPGALRHIFDLNLSDIADEMVDSQYFPCQKFDALHSEIYRYFSFRERAHVCEQWLLRRYRPLSASRFDQALSAIYRAPDGLRVGELADNVGCSARHLNRQFQHHIGLSTKAFMQVIRVQKASRQLFSSRGSSPGAALELGFFDQPHLINEFRKRLLLSPRAFSERFRSDIYNT